MLITDGSGTVIDLVNGNDAGDGIETYNGVICPGFINAHCHLELSHLKGKIPEKTGLVDFVQQVMGNRHAEVERQQAAMVEAESQMYRNGIVAVGDICNTSLSIPVKQQSKLLWHNFIEVSGFVDAAAHGRLEEMEKVSEKFKKELPSHKTSFSPHAPYSVSKRLFQLLNEGTAGQLITIHNQESAEEDKLYLLKQGAFLTLYENFGIDIASFEPTGKSSFQSWLPYFNRQQSIIAVHNTYTNTTDLDLLAELSRKTNGLLSHCVCINANQYIEQNNPPIKLLMHSNCNMVVGTDSLASNRQLNILEEIKSIQFLSFPSLSLPIILQWATINGARALQLDQSIGSFEKGKKPGVVLIENIAELQLTQQSAARRIL